LLLALHVVMLAGVDLGHPHPLVTALTLDHQQAHQALAVARPSRGSSMTMACLAMLAGLLVHATSPIMWHRRQPLASTPPAAPVPTPPTPPPLTLGVSRS